MLIISTSLLKNYEALGLENGCKLGGNYVTFSHCANHGCVVSANCR